MKRVMICVGGTGGHTLPAQAFSRQLLQQDPNVNILFIGGGLSRNPFFSKAGVQHLDISTAPLSFGKIFKLPMQLWKLWRGYLQSRHAIRQFRPDVVVGFGSYYAFPPLLAAYTSTIPIVLHAADTIPGKVVRLFSRVAKVTGIHFPNASRYLKGPAVEVIMPLREGYHQGKTSQEEARSHFGLDPERPTLLVFGGSQGAQRLNVVVREMMIMIIETGLQVIHITGNEVAKEETRAFYHSQGIQAYVASYEQRMDLAWASATVAITRAGAATIAEQVEWEVPAILIPYPHAADGHQEINADYVAQEIGGAIKLKEENLSGSLLAQTLREILQGDVYAGMRQGLHRFKERKRENLAELVLKKL